MLCRNVILIIFADVIFADWRGSLIVMKNFQFFKKMSNFHFLTKMFFLVNGKNGTCTKIENRSLGLGLASPFSYFKGSMSIVPIAVAPGSELLLVLVYTVSFHSYSNVQIDE